MRKIIISITFILFLYACNKEKNHPFACFTVDNPSMLLGDTVRIKLCTDAELSRDSFWDMGDGTKYSGAAPPLHVYQSAGTFSIKLTSYEHLTGFSIHFHKRAVSVAEQTVTVQ